MRKFRYVIIMILAQFGDILSSEWKRFEKYRPELTRETLAQLKESARYTDIEVQSCCLGHPLGNIADDIKSELF